VLAALIALRIRTHRDPPRASIPIGTTCSQTESRPATRKKVREGGNALANSADGERDVVVRVRSSKRAQLGQSPKEKPQLMAKRKKKAKKATKKAARKGRRKA
jgi:hypothetical protein